ncbi:MAG TPA: response regulator transcription factor [Bacteroidota bacterium]|nr:response regulator transcription factor [Bacteroidota bacterium]
MIELKKEPSAAHARSIVIIDDHAILRNGLRHILEEHSYEVIGEAANADDARALLKVKIPAIIILDIGLPGVRGIELAGMILAQYPAIRIIFLTVHKDEEYVSQALSVGAYGYVLKDCIDTEILDALQYVEAGRKYLTPLISSEIVESLTLKSAPVPNALPGFDTLTPREREVLTHLCDGKTNKEIAQSLFISVRTVEHHRQTVMKKTGVRSIADLIKSAIRKKIVEL